MMMYRNRLPDHLMTICITYNKKSPWPVATEEQMLPLAQAGVPDYKRYVRPSIRLAVREETYQYARETERPPPPARLKGQRCIICALPLHTCNHIDLPWFWQPEPQSPVRTMEGERERRLVLEGDWKGIGVAGENSR